MDTNQIDKASHFQETHGYLGKDFLKWLWFYTESADFPEQFTINKEEKLLLEFWVDDKVVFHGPSSMVYENTLKGGCPGTSFESTAALQQGQAIKELRVGVRNLSHESKHWEYLVTLRDTDLTPRGLTVPESPAENDQPSSYERLGGIIQFIDILDSVYEHFLHQRVAPKTWAAIENSIEKWIDNRSKKHANEKVIH